MASLYVKDAEANILAERLALARGVTKTAAVKLALAQALETETKRTTRERMVAFWQRHPVPDQLGPAADKTFFDDLSGGL